jgi:hypothetical protein
LVGKSVGSVSPAVWRAVAKLGPPFFWKAIDHSRSSADSGDLWVVEMRTPRISATTLFIVEAFKLRSDLAIALGKPDSLELYRDEFKQRLRGIREVIILCQPTSVDTIESVDTVNRPIATRFASAGGQ